MLELLKEIVCETASITKTKAEMTLDCQSQVQKNNLKIAELEARLLAIKVKDTAVQAKDKVAALLPDKPIELTEKDFIIEVE